MRIAVAMSGGVDSSVAAAVLSEQGHDVVGLTLKIWDSSRCCSLEDVEDARRAASRLGIAFFVVDAREIFEAEVVAPFVQAYSQGLTPNPCLLCNRRVKFRWLLERTRALGCEALATGHYARVTREGGTVVLRRGRDKGKDQSYFLFALKPAQLARVRLPLGELTKREVRAVAAELGLPNAAKPESQDVCFLPEGGAYVQVLEAMAPERLPGAGEVVDGEGRVGGRLRGYHRFTVGQRRGLGVAGQKRLYVLSVQPAANRVVVGGQEEALRRKLALRDVNWLAPRTDAAVEAEVQVRSRNQPARATVTLGENGTAEVEFARPVLSPAPGQAAVCYAGDRLLGGGWIVSTA